MNPAAPVTQTFISPPLREGLVPSRLLVGDAAARPPRRCVQLLAVAGAVVDLRLAELLVLRLNREDALRRLCPLVASVDRSLIRLAVADLLRERQAGIPAAGSQAEGEHADEAEQGVHERS